MRVHHRDGAEISENEVKVVFCTRESDELSGGQNTWLCHFLPDLRRRGVDVKALCFTSSAMIYSTVLSLRKSGIGCITCSEKEYVSTELRIQWLLDQLSGDPPDVFVINMVVPAAYYAAKWLRHAGVPTVGVCHVGVGHPLYRGLINSFVLGDSDYRVPTLVCVSQYLEQDVVKSVPLGISVKYVPCGVRIPSAVAEEPHDKLRLAYVGRLAEEAKRVVEVTEALCRAVREVPGTEAFIYGDGDERRSVERVLSENSSLPVHLVGAIEYDRVYEHLLECHVIVLLSDWEGFGRAMLEGMACGLVPIGFRFARGGGQELIDDGVTGLLVNDRGADFVNAVRRLRADLGLWRRLADSARALAIARYSMKACVDQWCDLLSELAKGGLKKPIRVQCKFNLPAGDPDLAWLDPRSASSTYEKLVGRFWGEAR